ncbi:hypothetical protein, partial [Escherichia coli]
SYQRKQINTVFVSPLSPLSALQFLLVGGLIVALLAITLKVSNILIINTILFIYPIEYSVHCQIASGALSL